MDPKNNERLKARDFDLVFEGISMRAVEEQDADGKTRKYLNGTASSTAQDLYGDILTASAQVAMLEKLKGLAEKLAAQNSGMTAFLNHAYKIPDDVLGAFTKASLTTRTDNNETYIDLDIKCRVTETNPRALAAFDQVKDGIRHGWSIGAYFTEWEWMSDDPDSDDYWSMLVTDVELLEVSLVGIPANQRAWCRNTEDLKARTVAAAERIAKDARDATPMQRRELVTKSLFAREEARTVPEPAKREGDSPAAETPEQATTTEEPVQSSAPTAPVSAENREGVADTTTTSPLTARGVSESEIREIGRKSAVSALKELQQRLGDENGNGTRLALECGIKAIERELAALEVNDLSTLLRTPLKTADGKSIPLGDEVRMQAADAIDMLTSLASVNLRDTDGDGGTPDDDRDKIGLAIGHLAKSVGHGLCGRGGGHVAKAIEALAATVVDQPGPVGNEDPETLAMRIEKLSLKAGDTLIVCMEDADEKALDDARKQFESIAKDLLPEGVKCLVLSKNLAASLDNDVAAKSAQIDAKAAELATLEATIAEKTAALAEATTQSEAAQKKLKEIEDTIRERGETRLGRRATASEMLRQATETVVKPEHYNLSPQEQQEALRRMAAGEPAQPTGRDLVA